MMENIINDLIDWHFIVIFLVLLSILTFYESITNAGTKRDKTVIIETYHEPIM